MPKSLTYRRAGVSAARADRFVGAVSRLARTTRRTGLVSGIGGFAGLFRAGSGAGNIWAASADGVGTKVLLARSPKDRETLGIDLVAMNVNDCLAAGAEPMVFLDYYATSRLKPPEALSVIRGIVRGCRMAGCTLLGGETAEMPGLYRPGHFDLAGFCVGLIRPQTRLAGPPRFGDVILGLASNGVHANGFSLVRKLYPRKKMTAALRRQFMRPTAIYVRPVLKLLDRVRVHALVHMTGGGWQGNIPRVLPRSLAARIQTGSWPVPKLFTNMQRKARMSQAGMYSTFNMGVGMLAVVSAKEARAALNSLKSSGVHAWQVGRIVRRKRGEAQVNLEGRV